MRPRVAAPRFSVFMPAGEDRLCVATRTLWWMMKPACARRACVRMCVTGQAQLVGQQKPACVCVLVYVCVRVLCMCLCVCARTHEYVCRCACGLRKRGREHVLVYARAFYWM